MLYLQIKSSLRKQVSQKAKKLVAVLATSTLMIGKKKEKELKQVYYIWYLDTFKDQD